MKHLSKPYKQFDREVMIALNLKQFDETQLYGFLSSTVIRAVRLPDIRRCYPCLSMKQTVKILSDFGWKKSVFPIWYPDGYWINHQYYEELLEKAVV